MKIILAFFFCVFITVSSESENSKTTEDQKIDNSAFIQKFLTPLHHDINQRYGLKEAEYNHEGLLRNYNNGYYDYNDENEQYLRNEGRPMENDQYLRNEGRPMENEQYLRNEGRPMENEQYLSNEGRPMENEQYLRNEGRPMESNRLHFNEPSMNWGYSRNVGELGNLMSHAINGEPYVWGNLRNTADRMRNKGAREGYNGFSRNEGTLRKGQIDMRHGSKGYGHMVQNLNIPLKPYNIGYVGIEDPKENGIKEKYFFRLIGRKGLGLDKRTSAPYGLNAPITPSVLTVVGRKHHNHNLYYYNEAY